ncbi:hypothetical protein [Nevskia ramosa]|uniref:hypothetical protein n=1 Tax=Nevskia ramosa TaxID=64002 RepID=UPI0023525A38|nr:hypothetical protein [Nevskia ramosa]
MSIINKRKPLAVALGAAFAIGGAAQASSLFVASDLAAGYMVASIGDKAGEHSCGEGGCGGDMKATPAAATKDAAQKNGAEAKAAADKAAADKAKASEAKPK